MGCKTEPNREKETQAHTAITKDTLVEQEGPTKAEVVVIFGICSNLAERLPGRTRGSNRRATRRHSSQR